MQIKDLLEMACQRVASDLHLICNSPPLLRVNGELDPLGEENFLTAEKVKELIFSFLTEGQKEWILNNKELDFSLAYGDKARFRVNVYFQKGTLAASLRLIPSVIKGIDELGLPPILHKFADLRQGFVLVTGPTGHGKSTAVAAMIEEISRKRRGHIVTIEDPIEFIYPHRKSIVSQREIRQDTLSWEVALRSVLREDPDVVHIGEMRDLETISAALTVAETGHLVFATLHTNSVSQTVDRIIDVFPEHSKSQVRAQLAAVIEAIISIRLVRGLKGGRRPAVEVMVGTPAMRNSIREGKSHLLDSVIQTSGSLGMITIEASLAKLVLGGEISLDDAKLYALRPEDLLRLCEYK